MPFHSQLTLMAQVLVLLEPDAHLHLWKFATRRFKCRGLTVFDCSLVWYQLCALVGAELCRTYSWPLKTEMIQWLEMGFFTSVMIWEGQRHSSSKWDLGGIVFLNVRYTDGSMTFMRTELCECHKALANLDIQSLGIFNGWFILFLKFLFLYNF